jgi:NRPS condensation-like uncharacterized protein
MSISKQILQNKLERWKQAVNQLISGNEETETESVQTIELNSEMMQKCNLLAAEQQTTINEVVNNILNQYWHQKNNQLSVPISREQLERNPLFELDSLAQRNFRFFGETNYE